MECSKYIKQIYVSLDLSEAGVPFDKFRDDPIKAIQENKPQKDWSNKHRTSATRIMSFFWPDNGQNKKNRERGIAEHDRHDKVARKFQSFE